MLSDADCAQLLRWSRRAKSAQAFVRSIYRFTNPVAPWLIVAVSGLYLAALLLARRRPRITGIIGLALVANAFGPASSIFYDTLLSYLERGRVMLFWLVVTFVVVGCFAGRTRFGTAARRWLSGGLESVGAGTAGGPVGSAGRWVAANAPGCE